MKKRRLFFIYSKNYEMATCENIRQYNKIDYMFKKYNIDFIDQIVLLNALTDTYMEAMFVARSIYTK